MCLGIIFLIFLFLLSTPYVFEIYILSYLHLWMPVYLITLSYPFYPFTYFLNLSSKIFNHYSAILFFTHLFLAVLWQYSFIFNWIFPFYLFLFSFYYIKLFYLQKYFKHYLSLPGKLCEIYLNVYLKIFPTAVDLNGWILRR